MQRILCSMTGNEWFSSQFLQTWSEGGKKEKKNCIFLDLAGKFIDYLDTISGRYLLPIFNQFSSICTISQKLPKLLKTCLNILNFRKKFPLFKVRNGVWVIRESSHDFSVVSVVTTIPIRSAIFFNKKRIFKLKSSAELIEILAKF